MPQKRDKTTGLPLPSPVVPATNLCVQLFIPNDPLYVQAFRGVLADLGKWWNWQHTVGEGNENALEAAELWRDRLQYINYSDECENPVSCIDFANCVSTSEAVREALRNFVLNDPAIQNQAINQISYTVLPSANRAQNLLKPDACEEGFIFNQVSTLVTLLNSLSTDLLQSIEIFTNSLERAEQLASAIPAIGGLWPIDEMFALADQMAEEVFEGYEADWDEGLYDEIRCALFCEFKDACEIDITQAIAFYNELLGASLPDDPVEIFEAVLAYIVTGIFPENSVVYVMHLLVLSAIQLSQNVLGVDFATMGLRVIAAGDEADNDWEILCENCNTPPETCDDLAAGQQGYVPVLTGRAVYHSGQGFGRGTVNASYLWIMKQITGVTITSVTLRLNQLMATGTNYAVVIYPYNDVGQANPIASSINNQTEYVFSGLSVTNGLTIYVSSGALLPVDLRLIEVCYTYA